MPGIPAQIRFSAELCCERFRDKGEHATFCPENPYLVRQRLGQQPVDSLTVRELEELMHRVVHDELRQLLESFLAGTGVVSKSHG